MKLERFSCFHHGKITFGVKGSGTQPSPLPEKNNMEIVKQDQQFSLFFGGGSGATTPQTVSDPSPPFALHVLLCSSFRIHCNLMRKIPYPYTMHSDLVLFYLVL